jgi:hypothetical protein
MNVNNAKLRTVVVAAVAVHAAILVAAVAADIAAILAVVVTLVVAEADSDNNKTLFTIRIR